MSFIKTDDFGIVRDYNYMTVFQIVPVNDGYYYVCKNTESYYLGRKDDKAAKSDKLLFETKELAQKYINKYSSSFNLNCVCEPEAIIYHIDYVPAEIIKEVI